MPGSTETDGALVRWLLTELARRNLSAREASDGAGMGHGAVSRYLLGHRPSMRNAQKLATYFEVPPEFVYHLAGYMGRAKEHDLFVKQLDSLTESWSASDKENLLEVARAWDRRHRQRARGTP
jgi:transcriptional regulator with XRE-family HTH domain